jgi:S-adenosylmethionine:tRNA ribosyltransferase-isomerase
MLTQELDYRLPPDRIATHPANPRDAARLMVIFRDQNRIEHHTVSNLPFIQDAFRSGDLLIFNQSKVIPAYFTAVRPDTGGIVKALYLNTAAEHPAQVWEVLLKSRGRLRERDTLKLSADSTLRLIERLESGHWLAQLHSPSDTLSLLHQIGMPPLPPYIQRRRRAESKPEFSTEDRDAYNTVFASDPGSVAAPTAGLHFTPELIDRLNQTGVNTAFLTLHVGLGTFSPIRTDQLEDHPIHSEWIHIPQQTISLIQQTHARGHRVIPVGTTTVRALESLPDPLPNSSDYTTLTDLLITPAEHDQSGFRFRYTDALITNFHLPRSTLLALVAALPGVGLQRLLDHYRIAIDQGYRFYSYGDAMLII